MYKSPYSIIEPFTSSKLQKNKTDFDTYIVNKTSRLEKDALENKMNEITNNLNTLDASFNNHLTNLNLEMKKNNTLNENDNAELSDIRQINNDLKTNYRNNLISSLAAKKSFKNEQSVYRKTLIESGVYTISILFSSYLIYKALNN